MPAPSSTFTFTNGDSGKASVAKLHAALKKIGLPVAPEEVQARELGATTKEAVKAIQARAGLKPTGKLTPKAVEALESELEHAFFVRNRRRTGKLQDMLGRTGYEVAAAELERREFGPSTEKALKAFQKSASMAQEGRVTGELFERLEAAALAERLSTRTQVARTHRIIIRAGRIAKLDVRIDPGEISRREIGESTKAAVRAIQEKYDLNPTGELDPATFERLSSIAASRVQPKATVKVSSAEDLAPISRSLRLNMKNAEVASLQKALAFLGYPIERTELDSQTFGKTTLQAVLAFQTKNDLAVDGKVESVTRQRLNREIVEANPDAAVGDKPFRIRGSARDSLWRGRVGLTVEVWETALRGEGKKLAERRTTTDGFFDVPYEPPRNPIDGQIKSPFHLEVRVLKNGQRLHTRTSFNPAPIAWVNFTEGDVPYRGESEFESQMKAVAKALAGVAVGTLEESEAKKEITYVSLNSGVAAEDVMRLVLAHRAAAKLGDAALTPEAVAGFLMQHLPPMLPSNLIAATNGWTLVEALVEQLVQGIVFMEPSIQAIAFDAAARENLIPIATAAKRAQILAALLARRQTFALEKPILAGNGTLKGVLDVSKIAAPNYGKVATAFLAHGGLSDEFWSDLRARPADFGGAPAVTDFEATARLGEISRHHPPTLGFLKQALEDPNRPDFGTVRDFAKLKRSDWVGLVTQAGGAVPDGTTGTTPQKKIEAYAAVLQQQSERMFPGVAVVAEVKRSTAHGLSKVADVEKLLDQHTELDLRETNLDVFVAEKNLTVNPQVLSEAKVLQRVHRIAPSAQSARALADEKLHSSAQIVGAGSARVTAALEKRGVDPATARTVVGQAEFQYAQVLTSLAEYRNELHSADPAAIVSHRYDAAAPPQVVGAGVNLETLFGALDFCDCAHCQSVYSPSAYLADVLRFLNMHTSETSSKTVRDLLLERRPDIGNVKLNCDNTNTPLPYVDLVCEMLEAAVPAPNPSPNFSFQTTRTAAELRAFPENVRRETYDLLRKADFPMDASFDLWQEEARVWLDHLGVPRHSLMDVFQARPPGVAASPTNASIAGEYLGMSSYETQLVVNAAATAARQRAFWGFDCSRPKVGVKEFLDHAELDYADLLALVGTRWINVPGAAADVAIERRSASCDLTEQSLTNLTVERFDRIHRFLRLWRRTGLPMWQLDRLIRASRLGTGQLNAQTLIRLHRALLVQERLGLGPEAVHALYHELDTEPRVDPLEPTRPIQPLYARLFQNPAVTDPLDADLALPLGPNKTLADQRAALLAALAATDAELTAVIARTDGKLTLANLTRLHNDLALARGLGCTVERLLALKDASGMADVFAAPGWTLDFVELYDWVGGSGFEIDELDFLLNDRPDSPHGLRAEAVTRLAEDLREALRGAADEEREGLIVTHVAAAFTLPAEHARLLLMTLTLGDSLLKHLDDPRLTQRDANDEYVHDVTEATFEKVYDAYRLLHKAALLVNREKVDSTDDLAWILVAAPKFGTLDLSALPVRGQPAAPLFAKWLVLRKLLEVRSRFPEPEGTSLRAVFDLAGASDAAGNPSTPIPYLRKAIAALTRWPLADIEALHDGLNLDYSKSRNDYTNVDTYLRLADAAAASKRLGVEARMAVSWALRDNDAANAQATTAQQVREAAKAKYDYATWLAKAPPMVDVLRERKRTALIRYLVEHARRNQPPTVQVAGKTWPNLLHWTDSNDLLRYFLIDVEMGACQLTSRIKQTISSVQMFVQRCFLNLEQPHVQVSQEEKAEVGSPNSWRQWRYFKNYRLWEASRKIFLYPENWILPELRDDKSPFFKELEDELLAADLNDAHAETAFLHYLEKLDEVARLKVVGVYHEVDDDDPRDQLPPNINFLHVVARTEADPSLYFYRRFDLNYSTWSAWERIDVDIAGDHVQPVIYNRKLHLFWLVFTQKPQKLKKQPPAQGSATAQDAPQPPLLMELQLAWTTRKNGGWAPKKVSHERLVHPWERPQDSYHLKPRYRSRDNILWLDIFISTSRQFNDTQFYDPFKNSRAYLTSRRFDETGRPWHSSSFLFDGGVVGMKMKPLRGMYHLPDFTGAPADVTTPTTSFEYVRAVFREHSRALAPLTARDEQAPRLPLPTGLHYRENRLANNTVALNADRFNVLEHGATRTLAQKAKSPFELVFSPHQSRFDAVAWGPEPILYQDPHRAFFVSPETQTVELGSNRAVQRQLYRFFPFYHPYSALFLRELNRSGVDGLLTRRLQRFPESYFPGNSFRFSAEYAPVVPNGADATAEREVVDFEPYGAFSVYNWEAFFHAPFMIACKLSQNQRFEEAMRWFHFVFDPTNVEALASPQRFWVTRPFFEQNDEAYRKQRIENLLRNLGTNLDQLRAWRNDPFNPHRIARSRPIAYQKAVVMKYIDNLIAWGDQLFRRDTLESINEATLLYVLAYELLGPRPVRVPNPTHQDRSYNELVADGDLDPLGNRSVPALLENFTAPPDLPTRPSPGAEPLPVLDVMYFCLPPNDRLLGYWSTVEDRLFKIRNCMNIEGVVRQLPLFEPPIDPALLVKAAAAGVDIGSVLSPGVVDPGQYRYPTVLAKAVEFCSEVRGLGDKLLSALEKQDAEALALLRSVHEGDLLAATRRVREQQIDEATETISGLEKARAMAEQKRDHYLGLDFMNESESLAQGLSQASTILETAIATGYVLAGGLRFIPAFIVGASGFGGSPHVTATVVDGERLGAQAEAAVKTINAIATALDKNAALASTLGSYQRRKEEWDLQGNLAATEVAQVESQIAGAQIRLAIAERELENLELQIEQSASVDEFLRSKYTNKQLYDWMLGQLTTIYFQAYKLAFDMALRAEKCLQFELGRPDLSFVQFGYWDSLKKGLLSGERLSTDLRRMEAAYLEQNTRELELTKHVSLAQFFPLSRIALQTTGTCTVTLPEWLFDMDFPGHYRRRIKSVSITIPAVAGPYTGVHATLSLVKNVVRVNEDLNGGYGDPLTANETRFVASRVPVSSIATSHGQNDSGLFELNFRDDRYLPFEGAGAASEWELSLPKDANPFDFASISDVILHVRYTAVASAVLKTPAENNVKATLPQKGVRLISLRGDLGDEWHRFFHPGAGADQTLAFRLEREHFPFYARNKNIKVTAVDLFIESAHSGAFDVALTLPGAAAAAPAPAAKDAAFGNTHHFSRAVSPASAALGDWSIRMKKNTATTFRSLAPAHVRNAYLLVGFTTA